MTTLHVSPVKLPHGKAGDISLPPDWHKYVGGLSKFMTLENGDFVVDGHHGGPLTVTTVPPRSHPGQDDPDGHTEFFYLSENAKHKVFNFPGFLKPVNTPKIPKYEVREARGKGRGVFATCDMHVGDLIWAERPFIVNTTILTPPKGFLVGDHHTAAQQNALKLYAAERITEAIIGRMTSERQAQFMSLANAHQEDGSGPCMGIVRTNQVGIRMVEGVPGPDSPYDPVQYCAVGYIMSLMNHSCISNIKPSFDFASFSLKIYAWGRIKKGDELVWSYIGYGSAPAAERQKALSPYGFRCKCRLCVADKETDTLSLSLHPRSYILANVVMEALLREDLNFPFHKKSPAQQKVQLKDYHDKLIKLESLQKESNSYGHMGQPHLLCLLHELYKRVGNETKRRRYANLVARWKICEELEHRPCI